MLSVVDLGIVHRVEVAPGDGPIRVEILPTFVGCPALELIKTSIAERLAAFGRPVEVAATFEVPWTSERISPDWSPSAPRGRDRSARRGLGRRAPAVSSTSSRASRARIAGRAGPPSRTSSARPSAGPSATARTAASRSKRSSRSDHGRGARRGRRGRRRDDGRRDRPARHRGRPRGAPPRRRCRRHRARARARIRGGLERRAGRLDLDPESAEAWVEGRLGRLRDAPTLADLAAAEPELVVEAALEDLEAKRAIFRTLDERTASTILATNTSALSVAAIAAATGRPGRVLGLHFFNPAPVMPLVEVVVAPGTDPPSRTARPPS